MSVPKKKTRVLFIEKVNHRFKRVTGSRQNSGLTNCIMHIVNAFPDSMVLAAVDGVDIYSSIVRAIQEYQPEKVIFEAIFCKPEWVKKLKETYPHMKFYVHFHSHIPFLSTEGMAFHHMREMRDVGAEVIWNSSDAFEAVREMVPSLYLPNIYSGEFFESTKEPDAWLDVACYGSIRPMKNQVMQAITAMHYARNRGKTLRFHMNLGRSEAGDDVKASIKGLFMLNPHHELISEPWREQKDFVQHLRGMDLAMQISMSETFNLVAADCVAAGIPIVVSDQVKWLDHKLRADCSSVEDIFIKMDTAMRGHHSNNYDALNLASSNAKHMWDLFLSDE